MFVCMYVCMYEVILEVKCRRQAILKFFGEEVTLFTCIHTYIHTYIHTCIHVRRSHMQTSSYFEVF